MRFYVLTAARVSEFADTGSWRQGRYFCAACSRAFTLHPTPRGLSPEKERLIHNALKEGISYSDSAITRTFNCSFSTVYALLKKP
jgi:hypothetical protein